MTMTSPITEPSVPTEERNLSPGMPQLQLEKLDEDIQDPIYTTYGASDLPPAHWANMGKRSPFLMGYNQRLKPGTILNILCKLAPQREPTLQLPSKNKKRSQPNGRKFFSQCNNRKENIEALIAQAVGVLCELDSACSSCQALDGKFSACVQAPGIAACANCHWERQDTRCSFTHAEGEIKKTTSRKRKSTVISEELGNEGEPGAKRPKGGKA